MIEKINNNKTAIIILHEIYGLNRFIMDICNEYHMLGFDVFCPDLLQRASYDYTEADAAYNYFVKQVGFEYYIEIEQMIEKLKLTYDKIFIIGFSVGSTIAWRCCENSKCDGIVCCYGSRIRDYLILNPTCPVLLIFANQDVFDVDSVVNQLAEKANVELHRMQASHGFIDHYSSCFKSECAEISKRYIMDFIKTIV